MVKTVTVTLKGSQYVVTFSALPDRTFGLWSFEEMVRELQVSALLSALAARDLVMDASVYGNATTSMGY